MIEQITSERASEIIDTRKPHGLYMLQSGDMFVGIDNETGDAWTEEFKTEKECRDWLNKEVTLNPKETYRKDFPEVFQRMAARERQIGNSCINGVFLDELEPDRGRMDEEVMEECGIICQLNL